MNITNAAGVVQYALRQCRLARVDVRRDTNVALKVHALVILGGELVDRVLLGDRLDLGGLESSGGGSMAPRWQGPKTGDDGRGEAGVWARPKTGLEDARA